MESRMQLIMIYLTREVKCLLAIYKRYIMDNNEAAKADLDAATTDKYIEDNNNKMQIYLYFLLVLFKISHIKEILASPIAAANHME